MLIHQREEISDDDLCDHRVHQNNVLQIEQTNSMPEPNANKSEFS